VITKYVKLSGSAMRKGFCSQIL